MSTIVKNNIYRTYTCTYIHTSSLIYLHLHVSQNVIRASKINIYIMVLLGKMVMIILPLFLAVDINLTNMLLTFVSVAIYACVKLVT